MNITIVQMRIILEVKFLRERKTAQKTFQCYGHLKSCICDLQQNLVFLDQCFLSFFLLFTLTAVKVGNFGIAEVNRRICALFKSRVHPLLNKILGLPAQKITFKELYPAFHYD